MNICEIPFRWVDDAFSGMPGGNPGMIEKASSTHEEKRENME
jgi:hypothetical protein